MGARSDFDKGELRLATACIAIGMLLCPAISCTTLDTINVTVDRVGDEPLGDTAAGDTAVGDPVAGDSVVGDNAWGDTHWGDTHWGDTHWGDTHWGDNYWGDTHWGDTHWGDEPPEITSITLTTTSLSAAWTPTEVINSGDVLKWTAAGGGISTQVFVANIPTFDFTANIGAVTITIESTDRFAGLTSVRLDNIEVSSANVTQATSLQQLSIKQSTTFASIDLSTLSALSSITFRSNPSMTTIDISNNPLMFEVWAYASNLTGFDVNNNPAIIYLNLRDNRISAADLDSLLIDLDNHGLSGGEIFLANNTGSLTSASLTAYQSLIGKGWSIDVPSP